MRIFVYLTVFISFMLNGNALAQSPRFLLPPLEIANVSGYEPVGDEAPGFVGALSSYYCAYAVSLARFELIGGAQSAVSAEAYRQLGALFILKMNETTPFKDGEIELMPTILRQTAQAQMNVDLHLAESDGLYLASTLNRCEQLYRAALPDSAFASSN